MARKKARSAVPSASGSRRRRILIALAGHDHQLYRGFRRHASEANWIVDASPAHYGVLPDHWRGDGILTLVYPTSTDLIGYLRNATAKVVNLGDDVDIGDGKVLLDNVAIGRMAAEHLLERGLRNFAFFRFADLDDVLDREKGFAHRLAQDGFSHVSVGWPDRSPDAGEDWFEWLGRQLRALPTPVGILAQNDNRAVGLLDACETVGLRVPEQVAVVGVDNKEMICGLASIPISSVASDRVRLAYEGAALLDRLMDGRKPPRTPLRIPPKAVIARHSTDILAIGHREVADALRLVWERCHLPITVDDVVRASNMSRCGLYRAFRRYVGRTVAEEIKHRRIEHAKQMLATTDEKIHGVAYASGFRSGEHLSRVFRQETGVTPSAYRRKRRSRKP